MAHDQRQRAPQQAKNDRIAESLEASASRRPAPTRTYTSPEDPAHRAYPAGPPAARLISRRADHQPAPYAHSSAPRNPPRLPAFHDLIRGIENVRVQESSRDDYAESRRLPPLRAFTSSPAAYASSSHTPQSGHPGTQSRRNDYMSPSLSNRTALPTPPLEHGSPAQLLLNEAHWETQSVSSDFSHGSSSSESTVENPADGRNWEDFSERVHPVNGPVSYKCLWRLEDGMCEYRGKKQLVKRHVENVHLRIRSESARHAISALSVKKGLRRKPGSICMLVDTREKSLSYVAIVRRPDAQRSLETQRVATAITATRTATSRDNRGPWGGHH
ncbi:hypothetical protein BD626DRAFT_625986 [Schizophyllum amplum]|uniref:Uncharacterized protein n=1 Tax=Schizophyllum amplum TaxID=97359 RepID=A0A550CRZ0_9AGAR|nr:hypothetical protein BD626DRAFT_625986 [Auriculariopsis ampla]